MFPEIVDFRVFSSLLRVISSSISSRILTNSSIPVTADGRISRDTCVPKCRLTQLMIFLSDNGGFKLFAYLPRSNAYAIVILHAVLSYFPVYKFSLNRVCCSSLQKYSLKLCIASLISVGSRTSNQFAAAPLKHFPK